MIEVYSSLDLNNSILYGAAVPTVEPSTPTTGILWYDTTAGAGLKVYNGGVWSLVSPISSLPVKVNQGGTGASTAADARLNLGVAYPAKGDLVVGTGTSATGTLNVGTHRYVLTASSAAATGLSWVHTDSITQTVNSISASTYTISANDVGELLVFTASTTVLVSIPSALALTVGSRIDLLRAGTGVVTVSAGHSNVSVGSTPGNIIRAQYSAATIIKHNTTAESYVVVGDLTA